MISSNKIKAAPTILGLIYFLLGTLSSLSATDAYGNPYELCPYKPAAPFVEPLYLVSKYDQSDPFKSTVLNNHSLKKSKQIKNRIDQYVREVVNFSDITLYSRSHKSTISNQCMHQWLDNWASNNALLTSKSSNTGKSVRTWTLASITGALIKLERVNSHKASISPRTSQWLRSLAYQVKEDYDYRLKTNYRYYNNHDHWAAWAVFSVGYLLNDSDLMLWGNKGFIKSIGLSKIIDEQYAYFPIELSRKNKSLHYTHYSMTPLVMLDHYRRRAKYPEISNESQFHKLVNFALDAALDQDKFDELFVANQDELRPHHLAWVIPYLSTHKDNSRAIALMDNYHGKIIGSSLLGGKIISVYLP